MASLANDKAMLEELLHGSGDLHSLTARMVFDEIPNDTPLEEIRKKYHEYRQKAKGYEFCFNYGGNDSTLIRNYGLTETRARELYNKYMSGFEGLCKYQEVQRRKVLERGFIILNKLGHRAHIYDFDSWGDMRQYDEREYRRRVAESQKQSINYLMVRQCVKYKLLKFGEL